MKIEEYEESRLEEVVALSLRAWQPVFESIEAVLEPTVYQVSYRDGWRVSQSRAVEEVCKDPKVSVWVALQDSRTVGFVALKVHAEDKMGEVYMIAVDPSVQRAGIATRLIEHADRWFRQAGMAVVMIDTGGDPGHAPARRTYESAGYSPLPGVKYFKTL